MGDKDNAANTYSFLLLISGFACAAETKIPVVFKHEGDDSHGKQLAYRLKEEVRKSSRLELAGDDWFDEKAIVAIHLLSMAHEPEEWRNFATVYSFSVSVRDPRTLDWLYFNAVVGRVRGEHVAESASKHIIQITEFAEDAVKHRELLAKWGCKGQ